MMDGHASTLFEQLDASKSNYLRLLCHFLHSNCCCLGVKSRPGVFIYSSRWRSERTTAAASALIHVIHDRAGHSSRPFYLFFLLFFPLSSRKTREMAAAATLNGLGRRTTFSPVAIGCRGPGGRVREGQSAKRRKRRRRTVLHPPPAPPASR